MSKRGDHEINDCSKLVKIDRDNKLVACFMPSGMVMGFLYLSSDVFMLDRHWDKRLRVRIIIFQPPAVY